MKKKIEIGRLILAAIALIALVTIVVCGLQIVSSFKTNNQPVTKNTTDLYSLPSTATEYQKSLYDDLAVAVNTVSSKEEYINGSWLEAVPSIAKMFITDYFTWSNKKGSFDVGGLDLVFGPSHINIQANKKMTFYKDWDLYAEKCGKENLPTVKNVTVTSYTHLEDPYYFDQYTMNWDTMKYEYSVVEYDKYEVVLDWEYEDNETFDFSLFPTSGTVTMIYRDNRLEVTDLVTDVKD